MRILRSESVLQAVGRKPRPLNKFEIEPLLYDLPEVLEISGRETSESVPYKRHGHGYSMKAPDTLTIQATLPLKLRLWWLTFHEGMLIGEIIPYVYRYLKDNPAGPERNLYDSCSWTNIRTSTSRTGSGRPSLRCRKPLHRRG